jgi:hypothetical protein
MYTSKRCKLAGRRSKSINIATKNPRKAQSENLQFLVWKKSANLFILTVSIEKKNTVLEEKGFAVSLIIYFSKTGPNPMALRITSD